MLNGDATDGAVAKPSEPTAKPTEPTKPEEITKQSIRQKVWKHLESNGLATFPRPVYQRIPNFKGTAEAADLLAQTDAFKNANNIFVNPDKPQEFVRMKCVEHQKCLFVPGAREQDGYATRINPPEDADVKNVVSRKGMTEYGKNIGIEEPIKLDMVVIGSVAVSKQGYRIGNGMGYSDLEFAVMSHLKAVNSSTIVVTLVHDCQVFDNLPVELFNPQDVPVDFIVTNTQVIETQRMSQRPSGILWHLLSNRKTESMPVLKKLREIEIQAGRPCPLKEVDTDPEERAALRMRRNYRFRKSLNRRHPPNNKESAEEGDQAERKPRRVSHRRSSQRSVKEGGDARRRGKKPKLDIDFSLKLSNITKNTRVRDLKQALNERGVKPGFMIWKGFRGYCYLHFLKTHKKEEPKGEGDTAEVKVSPLTMEAMIEALKGLQVTEGGAQREGEGEAEPGEQYVVVVEPAPPRAQPDNKELDETPAVTSEQATAV